MAAVDLLPPELVLQILQEVGFDSRAIYTVKEQLNDLCSFSLVNHEWLPAARALMYGHKVSLRNLGRATLLNESLKKSPELAAQMRAVTYRADSFQDVASPDMAISIIEQAPNLAEVNLGGLLFTHGDRSKELHTLLMTRNITALGFGYHPSSFEPIHLLVCHWTGLKRLTLSHIYFHVRPQPWLALPPPTFTLTSLTLEEVHIDPRGLSWIFGASSKSLRSLRLDAFRYLGTSEELLETFTRFGQGIEKLYFELERPARFPGLADELVAVLPRLVELTVSDLSGELPIATPAMMGRIASPKLEQLELRGRALFVKVKVKDAILNDTKPSLKRLLLTGPYASDPEIYALRRACSQKTIRLDIRRDFGIRA